MKPSQLIKGNEYLLEKDGNLIPVIYLGFDQKYSINRSRYYNFQKKGTTSKMNQLSVPSSMLSDCIFETQKTAV